MRGQEEIYLPASVSHEELNSQAQVKEPTLPIACPVILQSLEREHKATFTGTKF